MPSDLREVGQYEDFKSRAAGDVPDREESNLVAFRPRSTKGGNDANQSGRA